MQHFPFVPESN